MKLSEKKKKEEEKTAQYETRARLLLDELVSLVGVYATPLSYTMRQDEKYLTEWATFEAPQYRFIDIKIKTPQEVVNESKRSIKSET